MPFQTAVNPWQSSIPMGMEGDFCSANRWFSTLAGEGTFIAGPAPVIVGRFGFVNAAGQVSNNAAGFVRMGFIGLHGNPVIITPWLGQFGMTVQPGYEMSLFDSADVFMRFAAGATIGQKVFANFADGTAIAGGAGSTPAGAAYTASIAATGVMTVTAITAGSIVLGAPVAGAAAGTYVSGQLTGTAGGVGTYSTLPVGQTVASGPLTGPAGIETRWSVDSTALAGEIAMTSTRG